MATTDFLLIVLNIALMTVSFVPVANVNPTMWLLGGGAARQSPQRPVRGPAILATADGGVPQVQCITHNFATAPRKRGLAVSNTLVVIVKKYVKIVARDVL